MQRFLKILKLLQWGNFFKSRKSLQRKKIQMRYCAYFCDFQTVCSANNRNRTTYSTHANFITLLSINICLLLAIYDIHSPEGIGKRVLGLFLQGGSSGYGKR